LDNKTKFAISSSISDLFKLYLNFQINSTNLHKNITKLKKEFNKTKKLSSFTMLTLSSQRSLNAIMTLRDSALKIPLTYEITKFHKKLDESYIKIKSKQEVISIYMFIFTLLLICLLIFIHTKSLKQKNRLIAFQYAVQHIDDAIIITDENKNITYANKAFTDNTGYTLDEAIGQNPRILQSGEMSRKFYDNMNALLDKGEKWSGEFINKDKYGKLYYEKASITPIFENNKLTGYIAIKLNITDYKKEQEKVEFLAYHDSLTTLPNRRDMKNILKKINQNDSPFSLLLLDLDGFKNVNDTLGHDAGDMLLREISNRLKSFATKEDNIFRTGGDEFAIILKDLNLDEVIDKTKDILKIINKPFLLDNNILHVGASIGIAHKHRQDTVIDILKNADIAMYEAKNNGKNKYKIFNEKLAVLVQKNVDMQQQLLDAFINDEFYVVYQPKYDLLSKKVISLETLIRWENKKLGLVSPDLFIPIAENTKTIHDIGLFVFEQTCKDFKEIQKHCPNIKDISVNVSLSQIQDNNLYEKFISIIDKYDLQIYNIGLELTETHVMSNIVENIKTINHLRSLGFKIIIDDFGTGHSSLSYLKKLQITDLKIDKSFVDDICNNKNDLTLTKTVLDISKNFGYTTTAEGIETKEQEELLLKLGVSVGQGFLFSKPKKKADLLVFLASTCNTKLNHS